MSKKKNILLITTDQQRWDAIGFNNKIVKTPNLDKLASEGIVFNRAYTCNPVCTPARCSILTGHYPSKHGCYTIGTSLPENYKTIPEYLNEKGYFTGLIGKAHFQSCCTEGTFESPPVIFSPDFFSDWHGPYYGFQYAKLAIGHATEEHAGGMHYGAWLIKKGYNPDKFFGNNSYTDFGYWDLPEEVHPSTWIAEETIQAVEKSEQEDKPFFIWASFQDPHNPCFVPQKWAELYDLEEMPVYSIKPGEHDNKPPIYAGAADKETNNGRAYGKVNIGGDKNWHCVAALPFMDDDKKREIMRCYYGMMSLLDDKVGVIISYLEEKGILDDTLIVFTTDHGDYMGNHGMWWKGLPAYEDAQKIPFMVRYPNIDKEDKGSRSNAYQSLVDLGISFLNYAECPIAEGIQGVSQLEAWQKKKAVPPRDNVIIEFRPTEDSFMQTTFIYDDYKLVLYTNEEWGELYNLKTDPDLYENLWDNPEYQQLKIKLLIKHAAAEMNKEGTIRTRTMWA